MEENDIIKHVGRVKDEVHNALMNSLRDRRVYRWRPAERLAANIGAGLIGHDRHTPEQLQHLLNCVEELRQRLMAAKV